MQNLYIATDVKYALKGVAIFGKSKGVPIFYIFERLFFIFNVGSCYQGRLHDIFIGHNTIVVSLICFVVFKNNLTWKDFL